MGVSAPSLHIESTDSMITFQICIFTEKWALCYRHFNHSGVDTNMLVER